ncbi:MAG: hypothetical protein IT578_03455 [Verrucomicrobiae bacterium]|nr:hypothetical protein [Verrucomicrobiae bacterium]
MMHSLRAFLGQVYERLLAVAVLLLLVLCMSWLVVRVNNLKTEIKMDVETAPKGADAVSADLLVLKEARERLVQPPVWAENKDSRLFIAPLMRVLDPNNPIPTRTGDVNFEDLKTSEGFTYRWLHQYGLPTDRLIANEDPDQDGFTNREECEAGANPMDPSSRPDVSRKLRIETILQRPFPFVFKGIIEGSTRKFNVQRTDGTKAHFVELGGAVPDKTYPGYKVIHYTEKFEDRPDPSVKSRPVIKADVSELTLEKESEKPVVLVRDRLTASGDLSVRLYFILEDRFFVVSPGMEFALQNTVYQVVSIKRLDDGTPSVIIRRKDSPAEISVLLLDRNDLKRNFSNPADPSFSPQSLPHPAPLP